MSTSVEISAQYEQLCSLGRDVIAKESRAIHELYERINEDFAIACEMMRDCQGRIVVVGMGKSGHIGGKIAATLASTGSPAFFVHPSEAKHGDMGMITTRDVVLAISNSGETDEIISLIPLLKRLNVPLISMTGNPRSTLAKQATVNLDISVSEEACPFNLAPTSSTTTTLIMGDALAITLLQAKGFTAEDYAFYHPGGSLGKRLLLRIEDIMRTDNDVPQVLESATVKDALFEMTEKNLGMTSVVNETGKLIGVFTDGDLRRTMNENKNISETILDEVMTRKCKTITPNTLAADALIMMETHKIWSLVVVDDEGQLVGIAHMHDLLNQGL